MSKKRTPSKAPKRKPGKSEAEYPDYDAIFLARSKAAGRAGHSLGDGWRPEDAIVAEGPEVLQPSRLFYRDDARGLYLYHGDCLEVMDTLLTKHPEGVFDLIFADPPYFLSNGGITCHAGLAI